MEKEVAPLPSRSVASSLPSKLPLPNILPQHRSQPFQHLLQPAIRMQNGGAVMNAFSFFPPGLIPATSQQPSSENFPQIPVFYSSYKQNRHPTLPGHLPTVQSASHFPYFPSHLQSSKSTLLKSRPFTLASRAVAPKRKILQTTGNSSDCTPIAHAPTLVPASGPLPNTTGESIRLVNLNNLNNLQASALLKLSSTASRQLHHGTSKTSADLNRQIKDRKSFLGSLSYEINEMRVINKHFASMNEIDERIVILEAAIQTLSSTSSSGSFVPTESQRNNWCTLLRTKRRLQVILEKKKCNINRLDLDQFTIRHLKRNADGISIARGRSSLHQPTSILIDNSPIPFEFSFNNKLIGVAAMNASIFQPPAITSSFSGKTLMPFIWRDEESRTVMMQVLQEIRNIGLTRMPFSFAGPARTTVSEWHAPTSIDYAPFQACHLHQVIELLTHEFWPCIDLQHELTVPDHSIVVLYGHLVVGCGFIDTSPKHTHGYITFLAVKQGWRGCGIGKMLTWLLINSSPGKDILLHVNAMNWKAMVLYQKLGFKGEVFVVGFYDKYVTWCEEGERSSRGARNAIVMRYRR